MKGFTLVEMLVALLVFALLSAAGVAVMAHTVDNQDLVGARMDRLGELQRARALIRQDLAQAAPRRPRDLAGRAGRDAFLGAAEGRGDPVLRLVRRGWANPEQAPRASLQRVEYRHVQDRLERHAAAAVDGTPAGPAQVVLRGVEKLELAYHHHGQWSPAWPGGRESVPDALRLRLELEGLGAVEQVFLMPGRQP